MPTLESTIICDDVRFEKGQKISLMGIYNDHILVADFPFRFPRLGFFQRWSGLKEGQKFEVSFRGDGFKGIRVEGEINREPISADETSEFIDANLVLNFNAIEIPKPGRFIFETKMLPSDEVYKVEIRVSRALPEQLL